jgi:hypothetical protein
VTDRSPGIFEAGSLDLTARIVAALVCAFAAALVAAERVANGA